MTRLIAEFVNSLHETSSYEKNRSDYRNSGYLSSHFFRSTRSGSTSGSGNIAGSCSIKRNGSSTRSGGSTKGGDSTKGRGACLCDAWQRDCRARQPEIG